MADVISRFETGLDSYLTKEQIKKVRMLVKNWYHSTDSAIIKYFGGKHPVNNYAWDTANSEKIIWIKDAIETWANAIKK